MAKRYRYRLFNSGPQISKDFDPNTVYEGIEDVDFELEELEENIDNVDQPDMDEVANEALDEKIEMLMENNKNLLKKVNAVAEVVGRGISKAAQLKRAKLVVSHREDVRNY